MGPLNAQVTLERRAPRPKHRLRLAPEGEAQGRAPARGDAVAAAAELRIVVVDDDFLFSDMLPRALQKAILKPRLRIVSARTPAEAARLTQSEAPHVILCDYDLCAEEDGVALLGRLSQASPDMLRVIVSGHARRDIPGLRDAPGVAYLEKPIRLLDIVPPLVRLLRERLGIEVTLREP